MKRKGAKGLKQVKHFCLKISEATSKKSITERKEKQYFRQIIYTNQGHSPTNFTPDIDFTEGIVVHCDIPVLKNYFIGDFM